ncbi:MAG: ABC transporter permease [Brevinema sp.]
MKQFLGILEYNTKLKQFISICFVLAGMMFIFSLISPYFFRTNNLLTVALQSSIIAIVAIGQTMVLITGGIDLSLGSVIGLSGMTSSFLIVHGIPIPLAILAGMLTGLLVGLCNGILVVYGKLPPFVVTLGTMSIVRGFALILTNGIPISGIPDTFAVLGNGNLLGVPIPVWIMLFLTIFFHYLLTKTPLGLYIHASGSNLQAAKLSGIDTNRTIIFVYMSSGFLASIAGLIFTSRVLSGQPTAGTGYELYAVASSVIGGTSLSGGEGIVSGTLIGALIIGVLRNGLNLVGVSAFLQEVLIGVVIIVAVFIDRIKDKNQ